MLTDVFRPAPPQCSNARRALIPLCAVVAGGALWAYVRWRESPLQKRRDHTLLMHVALSSAEQVLNDVQMLGANPTFHHNLPLHVACCVLDDTTDRVLGALIHHGARNEGAQFTRWELVLSESWWHPVPSPRLTLLCDGIRQTPLHRILRNARRQYEADAVYSLSTLERSLRVLCQCEDVNEEDSTGVPPLVLTAVKTGQRSERYAHVALAGLLGHQGLEVNKPQSSNGRTTLHTLCERVATTPDPTMLYAAISLLLAHPQLHINAEDHNGDTALHLMIRGFVSVVTPSPTETEEDFRARWDALRALLQGGANPMLPNRARLQPYQMASEAHMTELCAVLKESVEGERAAMRDIEILDAGAIA